MVEYRTLSSAMMKDTKTLEFVWVQLIKALNAYNTKTGLIDPKDIIEAINNSNIEVAKNLISTYNLV